MMAFWHVISIVFLLSEARAQHGNSFPHSPSDYGSTAAGGASSGSGNNNNGSPSTYGNGNTGSSHSYDLTGMNAYGGSYDNGGNNNNYTYPPVVTTTMQPVSTMPPMNCPGSAPIGCRFVPLIDPLSGGLVYCLLICDQPVPTSPATPTTPAPTGPSTTTIRTTTPMSSTTDDPRAVQIESCISAGQMPSTNCSFNGASNPPPALTCAVTCGQGPFGPPCDRTAGTIIDMCLCVFGPPSANCTYTFRGNMSPLTCPQICVARPFTGV
ncbi:hypothetical protein RvY_06305 [Ramazzottius varieornatus]|uniref:EGF-like domain-containing protein n=1 Tax=Ramazzottius varieornatus TaxID=947166 RepID=A0A1D1V133_RAMVA|nr:hypothetical protein RvY_06305 [Ramazzottius varieornatus]